MLRRTAASPGGTMRSRSPQIAAIGTGTRRAASSSSPIANDAAIAPCSSRARGRRRRGCAGPSSTVDGSSTSVRSAARRSGATCRSQRSQWNGARRSGGRRARAQRAVLPGRRGLEPARPDQHKSRDDVGVAEREATASGPPSEWPQTTAASRVERAQGGGQESAAESSVNPPAGTSEWPKPGRSSAMQRAPAAQERHLRPQYSQVPPSPCSRRSRRARARLGAGDHRSVQLDAQRAEAGGEPGASQPGGSRGCARRSGSGP